jgi:hypothetical protein
VSGKPGSGRQWPSRSAEGWGGPAWSEEEIAYLHEYYPLQPAKEVAAAIGRSVAAVRVRAIKLGIPSRHRAGINSLVPDYFRVIDTPLKAYLLGLLMADGCISERNQLSLPLSAKDISAVELLRDELAPAARIGSYLTKEGRPMAIFRVQSPELAADLARHGVVQAKSLVTRWPAELPEELEGSFTCGYYDGDGSLLPKWVYRWSVIGGCPPFLEEMQAHILARTGIKVGGLYRDKRHEHAWSICATGEPVRALDEWVHRDVPGLARKRLTTFLQADKTAAVLG